jgi:hypothetical protein
MSVSLLSAEQELWYESNCGAMMGIIDLDLKCSKSGRILLLQCCINAS